ncbi:hypothetical protein MKW98_029336, partial [Papaver atlanticum]
MENVASLDCVYAAIGDFNVISNSSEKRGGLTPSYSQLADFNSMISNCGLIDIEDDGPRYTWTNKQLNQRNIQERLDRALVNEK